jgi:Carboxypeptidase regulatory-like domain
MRGNLPAAAMLIFAMFLSCVPTSAQSVGTGGVRGTVLNEEGQIVDHAKVCVSIAEKNSTTTNCRFLADKDGHFQIEKLPPGTYSVFAINEGEGYSIENQSPGTKVKITTENPWATVEIRLQPKGGVLILSVRDKISGQPIKTVNVQYLGLEGEAAGNARGDGEFRVTVPTALDLLIVVSAPGYRGWVYTDPSNPSRPVLRLQPGEKKELEIELEPKTES